MKKSILLLLLIFTTIFSFAQEFTNPDSAAIRKAKVKNVKIYYSDKQTKHSLTHEFGYDKNGHCIYSHEGSADYYYQFTYNEQSQESGSFQRKISGELVQGFYKDYYPNGKLFHLKTISEQDSLNAGIMYTYDTLGNTLEESHFVNGKLYRYYKNEYDANKKLRNRTDSTPGKNVYETKNGKIIRQTYYNENNEVTENNLIYYDADGRLIKTKCFTLDKIETYFVVYTDETDYSVTLNGKIIQKEEAIKWDTKFRWLIPRPKEENNALPYSDPVPDFKYKHELTKDKKGNVIKDNVSGTSPNMYYGPVLFDYEYEYW